MKLRVSIGGAEPPTHLTLPDTATITDLRAAIFAATPALFPEKHRLRLISAGKLLTSPTATLASSGLTNDSFVHCAVSDTLNADADTDNASEADAASVSDAHLADEPVLIRNDTGETRILLPATTQSVATLREAGLSDDQIIAVRFPYLSADNLDLSLDELEANENLRDAAAEGSGNDFWWGFLLGALLGLIMLILSMDRSSALSRRWKMGIGYGAVVNVIFGIAMLANERT